MTWQRTEELQKKQNEDGDKVREVEEKIKGEKKKMICGLRNIDVTDA